MVMFPSPFLLPFLRSFSSSYPRCFQIFLKMVPPLFHLIAGLPNTFSPPVVAILHLLFPTRGRVSSSASFIFGIEHTDAQLSARFLHTTWIPESREHILWPEKSLLHHVQLSADSTVSHIFRSTPKCQNDAFFCPWDIITATSGFYVLGLRLKSHGKIFDRITR